MKFTKLTAQGRKALEPGHQLIEHGIRYEKLIDDGRYSIDVMVNRRRIHRVIGRESEGVTRTQAEEAIEKLKTDAREERLNLPKGRKTSLTFKEAAKSYYKRLVATDGKNLVEKERQLDKHLTPFFGEKPIAFIGSFDLDRYKQYRKKQGAANGTINRELAVVSHLFNKAYEWGWIYNKPAVIKRLTEEQTKIVYLTQKQCAQLLETARMGVDHQLYTFCLIGLDTSMRLMEILSIKRENIDYDKKTIFIESSKTGAKLQPITDRLAEYLKDYIYTWVPKSQPWLFPSSHSKTGHRVSIRKSYSELIKSIGLKPDEIVRHTLRHTAITHLNQSGVDMHTGMSISGHKTPKMYLRYSHQNNEHIREAMGKLEERYSAGTPQKPLKVIEGKMGGEPRERGGATSQN